MFGLGLAVAPRFEMTGMRIGTQDQDASAQETYRLVLRRDVGGTPDCSAPGMLFMSGPLLLPPGTGAESWVVSTIFSTPGPPNKTTRSRGRL